MIRKKTIALLLAVCLLLSLVACTATAPVASPTAAPTSVAASATAAPSEAATAQPAVDPFGKYDPPIDISIGFASSQSVKFIQGESYQNNMWIDEYKNALGINLKYNFLVDGSQYDSKVNVIIASGDLPDSMSVSLKQYSMLLDAGQLTDMTDVFNQYVTPVTKDILINQNSDLFNKTLSNGRMMGIPRLGSVYDQSQMIWIRSDWLTKLNLQTPKTMDDLINIAKAFVTQDPDSDGKADTIGIAMTKNLLSSDNGGSADAVAFANMYHAYPNAWVKDASGNLVYGSTLPEMKTALAKLNGLYTQGLLDKEFAVKDATQVAESIVGDKCGIILGGPFVPFYPLQDLRNKNKDADWICVPLMSSDDKPALNQVNVPLGSIFVVSKQCTHPEAIVKMFNQVNEIYWSSSKQSADWINVEYSNKYMGQGAMVFLYSYPYMEPPTLNIGSHEQISKAVSAKSLDVIDQVVPMNQSMAKLCFQFLNDGDQAQWSMDKVFDGPNSAQVICEANRTNQNVMFNEFFGAPGPAYVEKFSTMEQLQNDTFTKIIMGNVGLDEFDKFVAQWKSIGGDDITKEINDWYATISK